MTETTEKKKTIIETTIENIQNELSKHEFKLVPNTYDPKTQRFDCECQSKHIVNVNRYEWLKRKNKCNKCPKIVNYKTKLTINDIINELSKCNFSMIENTYDPKTYRFDCKCPLNHIINVNYYKWLKQKNKCSTCPKNNTNHSRKPMTLMEVKELFEDEECKLISTEYINRDTNLKYICKNGHETSMTLHNWKNSKYKCNECADIEKSNRNKYSYDFVKQEFEKRGFQLISKTYVNTLEKLDFICNKGHSETITFDSFYSGQCGCIQCAGTKKSTIRHTNEEIEEMLEKDCYTFVSKGKRGEIEYMCPQNHTGKTTFYEYNVLGLRCGQCSAICSISKGEQAIKKHLETMDKQFKQEIKFTNCKDIHSLPFDFYVENKFIIEYDGIQHFKPVSLFGGQIAFEKRQQHDIIKTNYCRKNDIPLLRISYLEIDDIPEILDSFIQYLEEDESYIHFSNDELYDYLD